jgi:N-acylneuraminate cytidylyltransferase
MEIAKGLTSLLLGDLESACTQFEAAIAEGLAGAPACFGLGTARLAAGDPRGALAAFGDCVERDPENVAALGELVRAAFQVEAYAAAEGHVAAYLARRGDAADFRFTLAGIQLLAGRLRAAERSVEHLRASHPEYADLSVLEDRIRAALESDADAEPAEVRGRFVIAVIPARGGSKGIPRKNLRLLGGRPLLAHTVEAARAARFVDVVAVSTEDAEIARVARDAGAEVIDRPAHLASDEAPTEPALLHAVDVAEQRHEATCDAVLLLQATSPLRPARAIDAAVLQLFRERCDSVVGVREDLGAHFSGPIRNGQFIPPYDPRARKRRQDLEPLYRETGALYAVTRSWLFEAGCRMGGDMRALVLREDESMDIDTLADFSRVERFLAEREGPPPAR